MAVDIFLKLEPIKGESQDDKHRDEIEIESYSFFESNPGDAFKAGKVEMQDFQFVTRVSRASPPLFLAVATGEHFKEAIFSVQKTGADQQEFLKWTLFDVVVTSYGHAASEAAEFLPLDQGSFSFAKIQIEYKMQKPDGTLDAPIRAGWDLSTGKAF